MKVETLEQTQVHESASEDEVTDVDFEEVEEKEALRNATIKRANHL